MWKPIASLVILFGVCAGSVAAAAITVVAPNVMKDAVTRIAKRFEGASGHRVALSWGGSEAISKRITEGEAADLVLTTAPALDRLARDGKVVDASRMDIGRTAVAAAARADGPKPDIGSVEGLKKALIDARKIAISSGASGRYLEGLFEKLGVADQVRGKLVQPPSGAQIGELLARGEADLGFQQVTELMHAKGIQYLGPLPAEVQNYTVWAGALHTAASQAEAAKAFLQALRTLEAQADLRQEGMEPY
ncbi:MAG TPA: substrate-binding domain-containing protein [Ramlibacter sp.]|nr:substrate-binding domain-containing protein [Ramlibacter sp.]